MGRASSKLARKRWDQTIRQQRSSGLGVSAFCRREGVAESTLFAWKRRLSAESASAFVEVTAAPAADEAPLELLLGRDRRLFIRRGFDAEALREVVRALEGLT